MYGKYLWELLIFFRQPGGLMFPSQLVTWVSSAVPRLRLDTGIRWPKAVCIRATSCQWLSVLCIPPQCLSLLNIPEFTETIQIWASSPRRERNRCVDHSPLSVPPVLVWRVVMSSLLVFSCRLCQGITVVTLHTSFLHGCCIVCLSLGTWRVWRGVGGWERERRKAKGVAECLKAMMSNSLCLAAAPAKSTSCGYFNYALLRGDWVRAQGIVHTAALPPPPFFPHPLVCCLWTTKAIFRQSNSQWGEKVGLDNSWKSTHDFLIGGCEESHLSPLHQNHWGVWREGDDVWAGKGKGSMTKWWKKARNAVKTCRFIFYFL